MLQFYHVISIEFGQRYPKSFEINSGADFEKKMGSSVWLFWFKWYILVAFGNLWKPYGCEKSSSIDKLLLGLHDAS